LVAQQQIIRCQKSSVIKNENIGSSATNHPLSKAKILVAQQQIIRCQKSSVAKNHPLPKIIRCQK